jgi:lipopolysaccharide transport protein LptA
MRRLLVCALLVYGVTTHASPGQSLAAKAQPRAAEATPSPGKTEKSPVGGTLASPDRPVTTEIFADEAYFDSGKNIGKFRGHVKVNDPRFNMQSDKLTVYISKDESQGLEKAVAEGNVGVVRDRPDPNGGPPARSVGRSEQAVYTTSDGNIEMTGTPRVQQGVNTHIATAPDTVMVLTESGQLTTRGPSVTEIRQQPSPTPSPSPSPTP